MAENVSGQIIQDNYRTSQLLLAVAILVNIMVILILLVFVAGF